MATEPLELQEVVANISVSGSRMFASTKAMS